VYNSIYTVKLHDRMVRVTIHEAQRCGILRPKAGVKLRCVVGICIDILRGEGPSALLRMLMIYETVKEDVVSCTVLYYTLDGYLGVSNWCTSLYYNMWLMIY
jgi:hypothetical protein